MNEHRRWGSAFSGSRPYASEKMLAVFSDDHKFKTWRLFWMRVAECQMSLGLGIIKADQIEEMRLHLDDDVDYEKEAELEEALRHDLMAHLALWGQVCPKAKPIQHLGCTSMLIGDNTDLVIHREALALLELHLVRVLDRLRSIVMHHWGLATLGFTHGQAAQPTTLGKRISVWVSDLLSSLLAIKRCSRDMPFLGAKGATGTQASFFQLFGGDTDPNSAHRKCKEFDRLLAKKFDFDPRGVDVPTGQTYSREVDTDIASVLSGLAATCHKIGTDLRLMMHDKLLQEPRTADQTGSSAMVYKINPIYAERACGISQFVMGVATVATHVQANQWLERSLDDSSARRLYIPQIYLGSDAILRILQYIFEGLIVHEPMIKNALVSETPFMATERVLMAYVKAGGDRQEGHRLLRSHSEDTKRLMYREGRENDLIERLRRDPRFTCIHAQFDNLFRPDVGRAKEQAEEFVIGTLSPALMPYRDKYGEKALSDRVVLTF